MPTPNHIYQQTMLRLLTAQFCLAAIQCGIAVTQFMGWLEIKEAASSEVFSDEAASFFSISSLWLPPPWSIVPNRNRIRAYMYTGHEKLFWGDREKYFLETLICSEMNGQDSPLSDTASWQSRFLEEMGKPEISKRVRALAVHRVRGMNLAGRATGHPSLLDDVLALIQETWVSILERNKPWDKDEEPAYLYFQRHLDEIARQQRRKSNRRGNLMKIVPEFSDRQDHEFSRISNVPSGYSPEDSILLQDFLSHVSREDKKLAYVAETLANGIQKPKEIAEVTGIPIDRVREMKRKLRSRLSEYLTGIRDARRTSKVS